MSKEDRTKGEEEDARFQRAPARDSALLVPSDLTGHTREQVRMTRQEAGRLGGKATAKAHGKDYFRDLGKRGAEIRWCDTGELDARDDVAKVDVEAIASGKVTMSPQEAGKLGGEATAKARDLDYYRELGRKGAAARWDRHKLTKWVASDE